MNLKSALFPACLLTLLSFIPGCTQTQFRTMEDVNRYFALIQENNKKACIPGCHVFVGDSNMEFINVQKYLPYPACNLARRGNTTEDILAGRERIASLKPAAIVMLVGGNDLIRGRSQEQIYRNYRSIIQYYRGFCEKIYCLSNLPVSPEFFIKNTDMTRLNAGLQGICAELGATYVDVHTHLLRDGGLNPDYAIDQVHIGMRGHDVVMKVLKREMGME